MRKSSKGLRKTSIPEFTWFLFESERKSIWRIVPWEPIKHHDLIYVFGIITLWKLGAFEGKREKSESGREIKSTGNISSLFPQHFHSLSALYFSLILFLILFFCSSFSHVTGPNYCCLSSLFPLLLLIRAVMSCLCCCCCSHSRSSLFAGSYNAECMAKYLEKTTTKYNETFCINSY